MDNPERTRDALVSAIQGLRDKGMPIPDPENASPLQDWINRTFESMHDFRNLVANTIVRPVLEALKIIWRDIQRWYRKVRAEGTHADKQRVWRFMHPAMRARKRSTKRAHIYQMKRSRYRKAPIAEDMGVYD